MLCSPAGRDLDGDIRGYRSAEEQARELTRSIRREVNKLSELWSALLDRSEQWQRRLADGLSVSTLQNNLRINQFTYSALSRFISPNYVP